MVPSKMYWTTFCAGKKPTGVAEMFLDIYYCDTRKFKEKKYT
jgi:hypothetical protein